jgi:hypothetical protein
VVKLCFEEAVGLLECLDLTILSGDDLFQSFDADNKAESAPTTRSTILFRRYFSFPLIPRAHLRAAQVDAVEEELESLGCEGKGGCSGLGWERP